MSGVSTPSSAIHRLILIRHGETEWSKAGKHTGTSDIPLTPLGEEQAAGLRRPLDELLLTDPLVLSSPRIRATHTAALAGLTISRTDELFTEWNYGSYEGITTPQIRETDPGWTVWSRGGPGGESPQQMSDRMDAVISGLLDDLTTRSVILIGHGHLSRSLLARWIGAPIHFGAHFAMLPASLSVLGFDGETRQIQSLGITGYRSADYVDAGRPAHVRTGA
ncbi:acid phosphatase [Nocardia sp. 348MFTsu5.1]|uniref:acid phosphatase n=1 Tax=Nocardia sp. 348MFTsu5.1 TaxID=1172185 RepID=UPI0006873C3B